MSTTALTTTAAAPAPSAPTAPSATTPPRVRIWHSTAWAQIPVDGGLVPEAIVLPLVVGYHPGDPVTMVYEYDHDPAVCPDAVVEIAEQAFRMFNDAPVSAWETAQAARYRGLGLRSLSVGDVVTVGPDAVAFRPSGCETVPGPDLGPELQ